MSQTLTAADSATHSAASDGRSSGGLRLLLSNEFGLAVLIAVTLLVFSLTLDGFTVYSTLEFWRPGLCRAHITTMGLQVPTSLAV